MEAEDSAVLSPWVQLWALVQKSLIRPSEVSWEAEAAMVPPLNSSSKLQSNSRLQFSMLSLSMSSHLNRWFSNRTPA